MGLNYACLKGAKFPVWRQRYEADDCILYALGVGAGLSDAEMLGDELPWLYEQHACGLKALPSMASVLAYPGFWMRDPQHGIAWKQVVHGEQRMQFLRPLPTSGEIACHMRVTHVSDRGIGKPAIVVTRRVLSQAGDGEELVVIEQVNLCRGDGGYSGGDAALSDVLLPPIAMPPATSPDRQWRLPTVRNQAALYRLNADRNPLHIDPEAARAAGYARPILHGAALLGIVDRVLQQILAPLANQCLRQLQIRFMAPLYPGDDVDIALWLGKHGATLRCQRASDAVVTAVGSAGWTTQESSDA